MPTFVDNPPKPPSLPPNSGAGGTVANNTLTQVENPLYRAYGTAGSAITAYKTLIAWALLLAVLYLIGRSRVGYAAIYYSECLILFFLVVTQAQYFKEALSPITQATQPTGM